MAKILSHTIKLSLGIKLNDEFGDGRHDFECGGDGGGGETSRHPPPPPLPATISSIHNASAGGLHSSAGPPNLTTLTPETPKIAGKNNTTITTLSARSGAVSESNLDQRTVRSRISPMNFTEEKTRKLRMLTKETELFHDAMYHSAIASCLTSDFSDHSDL